MKNNNSSVVHIMGLNGFVMCIAIVISSDLVYHISRYYQKNGEINASYIIRQDITKMKVDAIVNPSNRHLNPTGGELTLPYTKRQVKSFLKSAVGSAAVMSVQQSLLPASICPVSMSYILQAPTGTGKRSLKNCLFPATTAVTLRC